MAARVHVCGIWTTGIVVFGCATPGSEGTPSGGSSADSGAASAMLDGGYPEGAASSGGLTGGDAETTDDASAVHLIATVDGSSSTCSSAASDFVYVLSLANDLYRFAPDAKTFTRIGTVACPSAASPNSMAIDRSANAWINYLDGTLYQVSTNDASCNQSPITLPGAWKQDGMAFSAAGAGAADALYLTGANTSAAAGLATYDVSTQSLTPVGQYTGAFLGQSAELTGTGDGRLFGFFATSPVQLAQINPASAAIESSTPLAALALDGASSYAFSFWGGSFYLYTYPNAGSTSTNVAQYDPGTGALDTSYMTDIGFIIVGAGTSTCAPVTPPPPR